MEPNGNPWSYKEKRLKMDGIDLEEIAASYGTPVYVYSERHIRGRISEFKKGTADRKHILAFAVKSNSNQALLQLMGDEGCGADIVSGGELYRAMRAGIPANRIVFSGVGKTDPEIREALHAGILLFSVESESELENLARIAREESREARISIRVNPDVDAGTHPYISTGLKENKFGIEHHRVVDLYRKALGLKQIRPVGIGFHIGSQLTTLGAFREAASRILGIVEEVHRLGIYLEYLDVGGGLGIRYRDETPPAPEEYMRTMMEAIPLHDLTMVFEPGRSIVGNAGVLLTRILYDKKSDAKQFYICDAGMNDILRPSLYQAYHEILPLREDLPVQEGVSDLVGPICETGDFIAKNRNLPRFRRGDLAAIASAGAYGSVMSSNYNSRPRPAEVLVKMDGTVQLIRRRESYEDLVRDELL